MRIIQLYHENRGLLAKRQEAQRDAPLVWEKHLFVILCASEANWDELKIARRGASQMRGTSLGSSIATPRITVVLWIFIHITILVFYNNQNVVSVFPFSHSYYAQKKYICKSGTCEFELEMKQEMKKKTWVKFMFSDK